jgi:peptidoglycan-N-acetylglucosamine deacetylase
MQRRAMAADTRKSPAVTVVIPARNEEGVIADCVRALREQRFGPERMQVIVVAAGNDRTAEIACVESSRHFGHFEVLTTQASDKNAALRLGCLRAEGDVVIMLDADTELEPEAVGELVSLLAREPHSVAHGAMHPRVVSSVSRYCELNRKLVKELRFDGRLSGEIIGVPRAALRDDDLAALLPDGVGPAGDALFGRMLAQRGWRIVYAARVEGRTFFPWTVPGLIESSLRNRRSVMAALPRWDAVLQAGKSALLVVSLPAAAVVYPFSLVLACLCAVPLLVHVGWFVVRVERLRRRGGGDYRRGLPLYVGLDLLARSLKLWAFVERVVGRRAPLTFRGERPDLDPKTIFAQRRQAAKNGEEK